MTLGSLLAVLDGNEDTQISILDNNGELLIKFNAEGYESISSTITSQTVDTVTMIGNKNVSITLAATE